MNAPPPFELDDYPTVDAETAIKSASDTPRPTAKYHGQDAATPANIDLRSIPRAWRLTAAAFLAGVDIKPLLPHATFYRQAKALRALGIEINPRKPSYRHAPHDDNG